MKRSYIAKKTKMKTKRYALYIFTNYSEMCTITHSKKYKCEFGVVEYEIRIKIVKTVFKDQFLILFNIVSKRFSWIPTKMILQI